VPLIYAHDPFLLVQAALAAPWLDGPMSALSILCEGWALAFVAAGAALWLEWDPRRAARVALPALLALALGGLAAGILKRAIALPRPLEVLGAAQVRVLLEPLHRNSFPSGHAVAAAVLAAYFTLRYGPRALPLWALAIAGGLARVYVGAHWTVDVLAGLVLGAIIGLAASAAALASFPPSRIPPTARGKAPARRATAVEEA
jgi:membrane-associated phospholipid phosphatase